MFALTCQQSNSCLGCQEDNYFEFVIPYTSTWLSSLSSYTYIYTEQDKRVTVHISLFYTLNAYLSCYLSVDYIINYRVYFERQLFYSYSHGSIIYSSFNLREKKGRKSCSLISSTYFITCSTSWFIQFRMMSTTVE